MATSNFTSKVNRDIGTALVTVGAYTVPAGTQTVVIGLTLSNKTTETIQISAFHSDGVNDTAIVRNANVVPGGSIIAAGGNQKIALSTGGSIKVQSSLASSVDVIMSILEIIA